MTLTYYGNGAWGTGKGGPLTIAEQDGNIWHFAQALAATPQPAEIDSIVVVGTQMTITLDDATVFGPYTIPTNDARENIIAVAATTFAPLISSEWAYHRCTDAAGCAVTVPTNASVPFSIGSEMRYVQRGAAAVTLTAAGGVTLNVPTGYLGETARVGGVLTAKKVAADEWDIFGDLATAP